MKIGTATKFAVVPEWVLFADVSAQAVRAYAVLARHADNNGAGATPSFSTIAEEMKTSRATAVRAVTELRNIGAVSVRNRGTDAGDQTSNEYTLAIVPPAQGGSQVDQGGSQTDHGVPPVDHGVPRVSHEREVFNESQENEKEPKLGGAAIASPAAVAESLRFAAWGDFDDVRLSLIDLAAAAPVSFPLAQVATEDFWRQLDVLTTGTQVFYVDEFKRYLMWWDTRCPSDRHKRIDRGFKRWVSRDIGREKWRELKAVGR